MSDFMQCTSCHTSLVSEEGFSHFKCPACGETEIVRCVTCRLRSNLYRCEKCDFEGP